MTPPPRPFRLVYRAFDAVEFDPAKSDEVFELRGFDLAYARRVFPGWKPRAGNWTCGMNDSPDTPGTRLVTILASDSDPGRVDRARMGRRNPADTEPRPEVPPGDIEATRAELAELRRRMTRKSA